MTTSARFDLKFFSRIDAGSLASNTYYGENLVLVVVLVLESKGLYWSR